MTVLAGEQRIPMHCVHPAGVFAGVLEGTAIPDYLLEVAYPDGTVVTIADPYRFWPTLGPLDLHLLAEGRHEGLWRHLGAQVRVHQGTAGTSFAVWAPGAQAVRVVGDFNAWDGRLHPMRALGSSGVWEIFLPGVGSRRSLQVRGGQPARAAEPAGGSLRLRHRGTAVQRPAWSPRAQYEWQDAAWFAERAATDLLHAPVSIYECHLGSWRQTQDGDGWRPLTYRETADILPGYLTDLGFTHVEFLPVAEHPFSGSWGYQVTGYYAPTARFGTPDDFRYLVDRLHEAGIGVIVDWVVGHFPKDDWALARFDGSALYEHADPRLGEHPDWGTLVFNYGRHEVRNFLLANALYWIEEFHLDGLRVDAVASMLYLDYSRREGEWVTNRFGGRENLEAIDFIKEVNEVVYRHHPSAMLVAEESTSWPAVSRPTYLGGLGFGFKWNMGWMNDTLVYFGKDPIHRRYHHHELTFALLYAFTENFILPLSHDEVVHGKGSLLSRMPGDRWQQFANLRALLAWMWAHPGRPLLFMGGEIGQNDEWRHDRSVDWHLLDLSRARGRAGPGPGAQHRLPPGACPVGAGLRLDRLPLDRPERRGQQRAVVSPVPGVRRAHHRLRGEPHPGAAPRLPRRAPPARALGGDLQLRQLGVRRQQRPDRRRHGRGDQLERPGLLRRADGAAAGRGVAGPRVRGPAAARRGPSDHAAGG